MSLRPEISGFSLDTMFGPIGSKDEDHLARLLEAFDESVRSRNPDLMNQTREILRRAIFEEVPWPDLEGEGEAHVLAAIMLARYGQVHSSTGSNVWKMPAFWNFIKEYHTRLPGDARRALFVFGRGRPIFGRRIDTPWSYYGFLSRPQAQTLHAGLSTMRDDDPSPRAEELTGGFLDELIGWLEAVDSRQQDLWFHCE
jgi:hypothetical protein